MATANLPQTRRFKFEDFPGAPSWFATFLQALNLFVDPTYQILAGNIGYSNLVAPQLYTKVITAPATGSVTFSFTNPLTIQPTAVVLGNVYVNGQPSSHPVSGVGVFWHLSQNVIYIDNLTNLTASTIYVVTLVVF